MSGDEKVCPLCMGDACEEGCGRGGRDYCREKWSGPDSHKVCRRCGGSGMFIGERDGVSDG